MGSRKLVVGALGAGLLGVVSIVASLSGNSEVAGVAQALLLLVVALLVLVVAISQRRIGRQVAYIYRKGPRGGGDAEPDPLRVHGPAVEQADLLGMVRLLQAQYVGRLDRAQATLEQAAGDLRSGGAAVTGAGAGHLRVTAGDDASVPVVEAALGAGLTVTVHAADDAGEGWVRDHGWLGRVVLEGGRG